ncbi:MAG: ClpX C4-type zinc finger protein [Phycisphaerales bacterium]|nr:hypothetical protein [Planctomycetota bacterium]
MQRPGTDDNNVQMSDILCDFCGKEWTLERPMVEGHRGACICGECLTLAYTAVVIDGSATAPAGFMCELCRENRPDAGWKSPATGIAACFRCIKQSAGVLQKDAESGWKKPAAKK